MVVLTDISDQSSSSLTTYDYDVFLSFRGEDTRYNFTDHLLKALQEATIDTFYDDAEIRIGKSLKPELENAIKSSRACIIVLSKDYATSTWCLDELALVMEQWRTSNYIVFPIFYHVKPSDVRKQQNSFGDAMTKYRQRMEEESNAEEKSRWAQKMEKWKKALTEVADMKGEEADGRRRETILIEGIVKEMTSRLDLHKRSEIPKPIGMESSIWTINSFLSTNTTEFLTIWGMAGIGKTYLADYIFKSHYLEFERSCFLGDIERRCTPPNGFLDLQKQLLKDIRASNWMDISDVNAGTLKIEKALFGKRVLLVLDGIDKFEQLDVLIGAKELHPGSKIIVTSKNGLLTEKCRLFEIQVPPKHTKHLLQGLNNEDSLQLLSWHAFGRNKPNEGDKKESIKVVEYCQGHPLALKVLGRSFRSDDTTWEDILESLGKEINLDIKSVLKVSFDTLPSEKDKDLFKHIACLFVGEDRKFTEDILKACGICKSSGMKILINRCLVTVGSSDELMMHQLLQDMGRDIVRQESPKKPWKRSILWHHEECSDVLQNNQGTTIIQGLVLDMGTFENETLRESSSSVSIQKFGSRSFSLFNWVHILLSVIWWLFGWVSGIHSSFLKTKGHFQTLALSEMRNLKLLQLNYVQLSGSYKHFPHGLRWLCMHGFPLSYIPSDLQMENMVALDMSNSKLQQLWKKPKMLRSLKFLNLSSCHELVSVGHFSGLPLLERLTLARCTSLVEVCESIGASCKKLEVLDLSECSKLKELPRSIGKLKNLTQLLIDGCANLTADNVNLKSDVCSSSATVEAIPRSSMSFVISLPRSLITLSLTNNNLSDESFPIDFSGLSMLKKLYLDQNPINSMPYCVRSLRSLETLSVGGCHNLKTVLCAPDVLKRLGIFDCPSLEKVTFHPEKSAPSIVYLDASTLTEIQDKFKMQALSEIDEEVLCRLGWINIEYMNYCWSWMANSFGFYCYAKKTIPTQMLYEHGIFSTYLQGQEVPKWFTHRSCGSLFTLQSSPRKGKIRGLNVCIVRTVSSMREVGPSRIEIRNLTKNSSWTYQPIMYALPVDGEFEDGDEDGEFEDGEFEDGEFEDGEFEDGEFEDGEFEDGEFEDGEFEDGEFEDGDKAVVWLSHWMFGKNEFEDGDEVSIHFSVKYDDSELIICYNSERPDYANVREYGISPVYDDDDDGGNPKEDPLGYYKSWKHIISGDLSAAQVSSSRYLLKPGPIENQFSLMIDVGRWLFNIFRLKKMVENEV